MLAPIDKIHRGGNDIIQVVITTACDRNCSNCTELLPFRTDYRFMSLPCFTKAVASLADWPGVVALFGGNPCVHPKFAQFCSILSAVIPAERRGLWTNNVFRHGALAAETFGSGRLNLNAHGDPEAFAEMDRWFPGRVIAGSGTQSSWHASILVDYRDIPLRDDEWLIARERCDINQKWSGSIVERRGEPFGYFCEVAGALDGIRGENHGIPAVPGWWAASMDRFGEQVRQCCDRGCGVPLRLAGHEDRAEVYDISARWQDSIGAPSIRTALVPVGAAAAPCAAANDYMRKGL